jgi:hypothetical protein
MTPPRTTACPLCDQEVGIHEDGVLYRHDLVAGRDCLGGHHTVPEAAAIDHARLTSNKLLTRLAMDVARTRAVP